jgi:hypothetical protein
MSRWTSEVGTGVGRRPAAGGRPAGGKKCSQARRSSYLTRPAGTFTLAIRSRTYKV